VIDPIVDSRVPGGLGGRFYGVYPAVVVDVDDPDQQGRVKVKLPWAEDGGDTPYEVWARLATMMAGEGRGSWFVPDEGDEVLVSFGAGDVRHPFVIGALWNGKAAPPEEMEEGNHKKKLVSREGIVIELDDTPNAVKLTIETPGGRRLVLDDGGSSCTLTDGTNSVTLDSAGVTVETSGTITMQGSSLSISAGSVSVDAGMSQFSGTARCDTLLGNAVVGSSYTPGAGNIW
jgi:uncharacterized protein involved in type VI secretion and phage assembly